MLLSSTLGIPLPFLLIIINIPFLLLGYRQIGMAFAIKSAVAIAGLALCLAVMPFPDVTPDFFLTSVFGGYLLVRVLAWPCVAGPCSMARR